MSAKERLAVTTATTGTGTITVSGTISGYQGFEAGDDGLTFDVVIIDGSAWEVAHNCTYTHTGTTLTRGTLIDSSTGAALNLSGSARVYNTITAARELTYGRKDTAETWTALQTFSAGILATNVREAVTANRTYYVRTDGSDSNNGLADTSGGAFLTLQKAWDVLSSLDLSIYTGTISIADGTYTTGISINKMPIGGANVIIQGNTTTPANVHVSVTGTCFNITFPVKVRIDGVKMSSSGSGQTAITVNHPAALVLVGRNDYGAFSSGAHMLCYAGAIQQYLGGLTYSISGSAARHVAVDSTSAQITLGSQTLNITGTPAFSTAFAYARNGGVVALASNTYSGSATGKRYDASMNGVINVYGAGATALPGDTAGTTATGGQYA